MTDKLLTVEEGRRPRGHVGALRAPADRRAADRLHQGRPPRPHRRRRPGGLRGRRPDRGERLMAGRQGRRRFGAIRRLPSGRYQVRYRTAGGRSVTAPTTFETKADAGRYLSKIETDMLRGEWADPRLGRTTFGEWADRWLDSTVNLRANTKDGYRSILRRYCGRRSGPTRWPGSTRWRCGPGWPGWRPMASARRPAPRPAPAAQHLQPPCLAAGHPGGRDRGSPRPRPAPHRRHPGHGRRRLAARGDGSAGPLDHRGGRALPARHGRPGRRHRPGAEPADRGRMSAAMARRWHAGRTAHPRTWNRPGPTPA